MAYLIEKNIPYQRRHGSGGKPKYPWPDMEVGDSVVLDTYQAAACRAATGWGKRHGKKFTTSAISERSTRVWRIA